MSALDLISRASITLGLVLAIGGLALDMRGVALAGVAFWVVAAAIMIGHAGPRRRSDKKAAAEREDPIVSRAERNVAALPAQVSTDTALGEMTEDLKREVA